MKVTYKNTGMIEEAVIPLNGLTIIAGENDTGKSTVGKLLYAVVKTFNRYERDARAYQLSRIMELIDEHHLEFRRKNSESPVLEMGEIFFDELRHDVPAILEFTENDSLDKSEIDVKNKIETFEEMILGFSGVTLNFQKMFEDFFILIREKLDKKDFFEKCFEKYMASLFNGEIRNKFTIEKDSSIVGTDGKNDVFEISWRGKENRLQTLLKGKFYFEDATFIESPVLLNISDAIRFSKTIFDVDEGSKKKIDLLEKSFIPEYMKDFVLKATEKIFPQKTESDSGIGDIIHGDVRYDHTEKDFIFKKGTHRFKGLSISQGVKYLGVIDILLKAGFLSKKNILILDEPENHLHPLWQIRLAEALVMLVKNGVNILLTSHSPYLIEALKIHSDRQGLRPKTAFCLSLKSKGSQSFEIIDISDDISPIFDLLADPFDTLEDLHSNLDDD